MNCSPLPRGVWPSGRLLVMSALDGPTDYEQGLIARTTSHSQPKGLLIVMPGECMIQFTDQSDQPACFSSDYFLYGAQDSLVKGAVLDGHHLLIEGLVTFHNTSDTVIILQKENRLLIGTAAKFNAELINADLNEAIEARSRWLQSLPLPETSTSSEAKALFTTLSIMKGQVCSPGEVIRHRWSTPDRWPHKNMWLWDSAFHAIGWRHLDPVLAREMIDAVFDVQRDDGFIPHTASPLGVVSEFTQPPILSYGVKAVYDTCPDRAWLESVYPKLTAYVLWDLANRDSDGEGLCEWMIENSPICRSGESGMDNSSRFDEAIALDAVDFNSFLALECETLAEFATILGRPEEALVWRNRHTKLCRLINDRLWSDEHSFYCDFDASMRQHSPVLSSAGFLPLLCGAVPPERAALLASHLRDPNLFGTHFPVPSISVKNTASYSKDMWRGPTWININWLIANALDRYEMSELAEHIRTRTREEIELGCEQFGTVFEYYDDRGECTPPELLRKGRCSPEVSPYFQVFHDYGWTACLYVDLAFANAKSAVSTAGLHA